jgi:hypothetical protein
MIKNVWIIERRKSLPVIAVATAIVTTICLFMKTPYVELNVVLFFSMLAFGFATGVSLMHDTYGTSGFVMSKSYSRERLFRYRWLMGASAVLFVNLLIMAAVVLGVREMIQVHMMNSLWYPMVRWFELRGIVSIFAGGWLGYQIGILAIVRTTFFGKPGGLAERRPVLVSLMVIIPLVGIVFLGPHIPSSAILPEGFRIWGVVAAAWLLALTVLTYFTGRHAYRIREINE